MKPEYNMRAEPVAPGSDELALVITRNGKPIAGSNNIFVLLEQLRQFSKTEEAIGDRMQSDPFYAGYVADLPCA